MVALGRNLGWFLLLLQGSTGLEFRDGWVSSAAVTFIKVKSSWPQFSADAGGAGSLQTKSGSLDRAFHKGSSRPPAMRQTPFAGPLASLCPCTPVLPHSTPLPPKTPCSHLGELVAFGVLTPTPTPPAKPKRAFGGQNPRWPDPGKGDGQRDHRPRGLGSGGSWSPGPAAHRVQGHGLRAGDSGGPGSAKQPLDGSVSPRQRC